MPAAIRPRKYLGATLISDRLREVRGPLLLSSIISILFIIPIWFGLRGYGGGIRVWQYAAALAVALVITLQRQWRMEGVIPRRYLAVPAVLSFVLFMTTAFSKFYAVQLNGIDFSIFDWMLYGTHSGRLMYSPIYAVNHLSVHASWIMFPLSLLHSIFPSPFLLLFVGAGALWLASVPLFHLAIRNRLTDLEAFLLVFAYLTSPYVGTVLNEGFRIESFLPLFAFTFFLGWDLRKRLGWVASAVLLLCVKEDVAFYLLPFGLYMLFQKGRRLDGVLLGGLAGGMAAFNLLWAQPHFADSDAWHPSYLEFWSGYGDNMQAILNQMLHSPWQVLTDIASSGWWKLYLPLCLLPLFYPPVFLASLAGIFLLGTATGYEAIHQYGQHYALLLFVFAFYGLVQVRRRLLTPSWAKVWALVLLTSPLWNVGWIRVDPADAETIDALAAAQDYVRQHNPDQTLCTQAIAFPHFGYDLKLRPLDVPCVHEEGALVLLVRGKDPYPYSPELIDRMLANRTGEVFAQGQVHIVAASSLQTFF